MLYRSEALLVTMGVAVPVLLERGVPVLLERALVEFGFIARGASRLIQSD